MKNSCMFYRTIKGMDAQTEAEVTQMIKDDFGEKDLNTHVGRVRECLQNPDLLTVFQLDDVSSSSKDVDIAILKAMLKGRAPLPKYTYHLNIIAAIICIH